MADELMLEILKDLQSRLAVLPPMQASLARLGAEVATLTQAVGLLQQDVRMMRAAMNDFARTNVTTGEVESLHADVNRLQGEVRDRQIRLHLLENPPKTLDNLRRQLGDGMLMPDDIVLEMLKDIRSRLVVPPHLEDGVANPEGRFASLELAVLLRDVSVVRAAMKIARSVKSRPRIWM